MSTAINGNGINRLNNQAASLLTKYEREGGQPILGEFEQFADYEVTAYLTSLVRSHKTQLDRVVEEINESIAALDESKATYAQRVQDAKESLSKAQAELKALPSDKTAAKSVESKKKTLDNLKGEPERLAKNRTAYSKRRDTAQAAVDSFDKLNRLKQYDTCVKKYKVHFSDTATLAATSAVQLIVHDLVLHSIRNAHAIGNKRIYAYLLRKDLDKTKFWPIIRNLHAVKKLDECVREEEHKKLASKRDAEARKRELAKLSEADRLAKQSEIDAEKKEQARKLAEAESNKNTTPPPNQKLFLNSLHIVCKQHVYRVPRDGNKKDELHTCVPKCFNKHMCDIIAELLGSSLTSSIKELIDLTPRKTVKDDIVLAAFRLMMYGSQPGAMKEIEDLTAKVIGQYKDFKAKRAVDKNATPPEFNIEYEKPELVTTPNPVKE